MMSFADQEHFINVKTILEAKLTFCVQKYRQAGRVYWVFYNKGWLPGCLPTHGSSKHLLPPTEARGPACTRSHGNLVIELRGSRAAHPHFEWCPSEPT